MKNQINNTPDKTENDTNTVVIDDLVKTAIECFDKIKNHLVSSIVFLGNPFALSGSLPDSKDSLKEATDKMSREELEAAKEYEVLLREAINNFENRLEEIQLNNKKPILSTSVKPELIRSIKGINELIGIFENLRLNDEKKP